MRLLSLLLVVTCRVRLGSGSQRSRQVVLSASDGGNTSDSENASGSGSQQPEFLGGTKTTGASLRIGTTVGASNVVDDFDVVPTWQSGDDLAASVDMRTPSTSFYLTTVDGPLELARASISASRSVAAAKPRLVGALAEFLRDHGKASLGPGEARSLTVEYGCVAQGEVELAMKLEFEGLSPTIFSWRKSCGGETNTALRVVARVAGATDEAVLGGVPRWNELKVVRSSEPETAFDISIDPLSESDSEELSSFRAWSRGTCTVEAIGPALNPQTTVNSAAPTSATVQYTCTQPGTCLVTAELRFFPDMAPYRPLRWHWTKFCGGSAFGLGVFSDVGGEQRVLASDGAANASTSEWRVGEKVGSQTVTLVNDERRSHAEKLHLGEVRVRCLDSVKCEAELEDKEPRELLSKEPQALNLKYTCHRSGDSMVEFVVVPEGGEPITMMWNKECSVFSDSAVGLMVWALLCCTCVACAFFGCLRFFDTEAVDKEHNSIRDDGTEKTPGGGGELTQMADAA